MKTLLLFFTGLSLPLFSGYVIVAFIEKKERVFSYGEKFLLSFALGTGTLTVYMLCLGIAGLSYSKGHFVPYLIAFILGCLCLFSQGRPVFFRGEASSNSEGGENKVPLTLAQKILTGVFLSIMAFKLVFVASHVLYMPTCFDDAFTHWNLRAKIIFYEGKLSMDPESESFLGGSHKKHYPLYIQLLKAYVMTAIGRWSEPAAKLLSSLYGFLLLATVYVHLKGVRSRFVPFLAVYLLASVPFFLVHSASNYADLTISFFLTSSAIYLCKWFDSGKGPHFIASACLLGVANLTKNEGLVLYTPSILLTLFLFLVSRKEKIMENFKKVALYMAAALAVDAVWIAIKWKFGLAFDQSDKGTALEFHPEAFYHLYQKLFFEGEYDLFWLGLLLTIIAGWKILKEPPLRYNFIFLGAACAASLLPYILTHNFLFLQNEMTIHRSMLALIPFAVYSCGLVLDGLYTRWENEKL
ncbi:MAG: glycosyltransferase family 39 protein [Nitrospinae bacterium]|nr:glycosyltransferase family 39 protein [Nitrospinota bacterium]